MQEKESDKTILQKKIRDACDAFYNVNVLSKTGDLDQNVASDKKISMSSTALDEHDKMKEMWAFNMPCMLLVNNGRQFWTDTARDVYKMLYKDVLIKIRVSLAASLIEIVKLINLKEDTEEANEATRSFQADFDMLCKDKERTRRNES